MFKLVCHHSMTGADLPRLSSADTLCPKAKHLIMVVHMNPTGPCAEKGSEADLPRAVQTAEGGSQQHHEALQDNRIPCRHAALQESSRQRGARSQQDR